MVTRESQPQEASLAFASQFLASQVGYPEWFNVKPKFGGELGRQLNGYRSNEGSKPLPMKALRLHSGVIEIRDFIYCYRYLLEITPDEDERIVTVRGVLQWMPPNSTVRIANNTDFDWSEQEDRLYIDGFGYFSRGRLALFLKNPEPNPEDGRPYDHLCQLVTDFEPVEQEEYPDKVDRTLVDFPHLHSISLPLQRCNVFDVGEIERRPVGIWDIGNAWFPKLQIDVGGADEFQRMLDDRRSQVSPKGLPYFHFLPHDFQLPDRPSISERMHVNLSVDWQRCEKEIRFFRLLDLDIGSEEDLRDWLCDPSVVGLNEIGSSLDDMVRHFIDNQLIGFWITFSDITRYTGLKGFRGQSPNGPFVGFYSSLEVLQREFPGMSFSEKFKAAAKRLEAKFA